MEFLRSYDKIMVKDGKAICPVCGKKAICPIRPDTVMRNVQHKCKLCRNEYLVNIGPFEPATKASSA